MNTVPPNYLLDANTCIRYLNGRSKNVRLRMQQTPMASVAVCSVIKGELFAGAAKSNTPARTLARQQAFFAPLVSLPFDDSAAQIYGHIRASLELQGTPIGPYDLQIATIALAHHRVLVTHNSREFSRIPGLHLEDWEI